MELHAGILVSVVEGVEVRAGGNRQARAMQITIAQVVDVLLARSERRRKDVPHTEFLQNGNQTILHRHIGSIMNGIATHLRGNQVGHAKLFVRIHPHQRDAFVLLGSDLRLRFKRVAYLLRNLVLFEHHTHESPQLWGIDDSQHKVENLKTCVIQQRGVLPICNGSK